MTIIHKLLPAIVSFYFFDATVQLINRANLRDLHDMVVKKVYKGLTDNKLEKYLTRYSSLITYRHDPDELSGTQIFLSRFLKVIVIIVLPIVFEIYALTRLFWQYGINDLFVWISFSISIIFMAQAYLSLFRILEY